MPQWPANPKRFNYLKLCLICNPAVSREYYDSQYGWVKIDNALHFNEKKRSRNRSRWTKNPKVKKNKSDKIFEEKNWVRKGGEKRI